METVGLWGYTTEDVGVQITCVANYTVKAFPEVEARKKVMGTRCGHWDLKMAMVNTDVKCLYQVLHREWKIRVSITFAYIWLPSKFELMSYPLLTCRALAIPKA